MESTLLIVNYHYVHEKGVYPYKGIHPTTPHELESQLRLLAGMFEMISGLQLVGLIREGKSLPRKTCLVTFDDGLKDHVQNALPVLHKLGISASFFVCTQPLTELKALTVHKIHWLRATRTPDDFLGSAMEAAQQSGVTIDLDKIDAEKANRQYLYDDEGSRKIKFLLNHILSPDETRCVVDTMFAKETNEGDFCRSFYMPAGDIGTLLNEGQNVGSHTHSHTRLSALRTEYLRRELDLSRTILQELTGRPIDMLSYPYGGATAVSGEVIKQAEKSGYQLGITMERSLNRSLAQPLILARLSTNDVPGGRSPLLKIRNDNFNILPPMTLARQTYFDERGCLNDALADFGKPLPDYC